MNVELNKYYVQNTRYYMPFGKLGSVYAGVYIQTAHDIYFDYRFIHEDHIKEHYELADTTDGSYDRHIIDVYSADGISGFESLSKEKGSLFGFDVGPFDLFNSELFKNKQEAEQSS